MSQPLNDSITPNLDGAGNPYGDVALTRLAGSVFTGEVGIGTPAQTFGVVFDTGSADVWVHSSDTDNKVAWCRYYQRNASSSFDKEARSQPFYIQYGMGYASGTTVVDTVNCGGFQAIGYKFAEANGVSANFVRQSQPIDGVLGLGFSENSVLGKSLLDFLFEHGAITKRQFTFNFFQDNSIVFDVGDVMKDPNMNDLKEAQFTKTPILNSNMALMWAVEGAVAIEGASDDGECTGDDVCAIIVDSGTNYIGIPTLMFEGLFKLIITNRNDCSTVPNSAISQITCKSASFDGLPKVTFTINDNEYSMFPSTYFQDQKILFYPTQRVSFGANIILGSIFLQSYQVVFDLDDKQLWIEKTNQPLLSPGMSVLLAFGVVAVLVALLVLFLRCRRRREPCSCCGNRCERYCDCSPCERVCDARCPNVCKRLFCPRREQAPRYEHFDLDRFSDN